MPLNCAPCSCSTGMTPTILDCYRNFGEDELDDDDVPSSPSNEYELVAQVDLMFQSDHPPVQIEGVMTFPLNPNVPPEPISPALLIEPSSTPSSDNNNNNSNNDWTSFATSVLEQSNQFLHHRSKELAFLYFGVLLLFLVLLTAIKYFMETSVMEGIGIGACLVGILTFVVAFNRLPIWHDASLDDKILDITSRQPLLHRHGYYLTYVRDNPSEGFMGVTRRIRIYQSNKETYQSPVLRHDNHYNNNNNNNNSATP